MIACGPCHRFVCIWCYKWLEIALCRISRVPFSFIGCRRSHWFFFSMRIEQRQRATQQQIAIASNEPLFQCHTDFSLFAVTCPRIVFLCQLNSGANTLWLVQIINAFVSPEHSRLWRSRNIFTWPTHRRTQQLQAIKSALNELTQTRNHNEISILLDFT